MTTVNRIPEPQKNICFSFNELQDLNIDEAIEPKLNQS